MLGSQLGAGRVECDGVAFCLQGRSLSCPVAMVSTGSILKSACKCFLSGTVSRVFKFRVDDNSDSAGVAFEMMKGSCQGDSVKSACNVRRFGVGGTCMTSSGRGFSALVGRDSSGRNA